MSTTNAVSGAGSSSSLYQTGMNKAMDKDAFLMLLITQLQNQDPTSPMKDQDFVAQLAQFSSLEQMSNMSSNLESFTKSATSSQAFGMTGKWVDYTDADGNARTGRIDSVSVEAGVPLLKIGEDSVRMGDIANVYPGVDSFGKVKTTNQALDLISRKIDFVDSATGQMLSGTVSGVSIEDGWPKLEVGNHKVGFDEVLRIYKDTGVDSDSDVAAQAAAMVGMKIDFRDGDQVLSGQVDSVSLDSTGRRLKIGARLVDLGDVVRVYPAGS